MYEREENAQFSLISYSKERRFTVVQTLPDSWKNKKPSQVLMNFWNKCTIEIIWAKYEGIQNFTTVNRFSKITDIGS